MDSFQREFKEIQNRSDKAIQSINNGTEWLRKNVKHGASITKIKILEKDLRSINNLLKASKKRPSIAIFGQSQVGKSFLVRTLAKSPKTSKLEVLKGDGTERIDFLQRINPPGGRESTGIITRFSTSFPKLINPAYNFKLELISQLDLAAILVNAYLGNIKEFINDFDRDEIVKMMINLKNTINTNTHEVNADDVYNFNKYIQDTYRDNFIIKAAQSINYFNDLTEILPTLPYNERWKPLSHLWGQNEFLTNLFIDLSETLAKLSFNKVVYTNSDAVENNPALISKEFSDSSNILDVARVKEIYKEEQLPSIAICDQDGNLINLERGKICALIKELHLTLPQDFEAASTTEFLNYTDLLDFPGSKNQETTPESIFNANNAEEKLSAFVRGKVSYLFSMYNRELGISTLLYCMDQNPPEVPDSPFFLRDYVRQYIGEDITQRLNHEKEVMSLLKTHNVSLKVPHLSPLLVAMTKFNVELAGKGDAEKAGEVRVHDAKWFARFQENFCTYMQKPIQDKWIDSWTGTDESFKFLFPIRDPGFSTSIFEGYKLTGSETNIREEAENLIDDMRLSFLNSEVVDKFIFDKNELWDNLLTPNKTGIDYLCKHLSPSSHPANMIAQLNSVLNKAIESSTKVLEGEYQSGNMDEALQTAKKKGANAFMALVKLSNSNNKVLTDYLSEMVVKESEIWRILYEFKLNLKTDGEDGVQKELNDVSEFTNLLNSIGISAEPPINIDKINSELQSFYGVSENELTTIIKDQLGVDLDVFLNPENARKTPSDEFTNLIFEFWMNKLSQVVINVQTQYEVSQSNIEAINSIIGELINANVLNNVRSLMYEAVSETFAVGISEDRFNMLAGSVASILNRFTFSASWLFEDENEKPLINKTEQRIFHEPIEIKADLLMSKETIENSSKKYMSNFTIGVKELFTANVKREYGINNTFDSEANQKIGIIINDLKQIH